MADQRALARRRPGDHVEWRRGDYSVSTNPALLDREMIHRFLEASYWAAGIPRDVVERSIAGSLPFGLYREHERGQEQIGFARVITDGATFAWVADVFVVGSRRGEGLGVWLMECIASHPDLQGLRRWMLATRDAHELYRKVGFGPPADPGRLMERVDPEVYSRMPDGAGADVGASAPSSTGVSPPQGRATIIEGSSTQGRRSAADDPGTERAR
jgi:GNAT superfamily N-acetyltransferase